MQSNAFYFHLFIIWTVTSVSAAVSGFFSLFCTAFLWYVVVWSSESPWVILCHLSVELHHHRCSGISGSNIFASQNWLVGVRGFCQVHHRAIISLIFDRIFFLLCGDLTLWWHFAERQNSWKNCQTMHGRRSSGSLLDGAF